jgi:hypothetical protein
MRFRLRTLLLALAIAPALIAGWYLLVKDRAAKRKMNEQFRNSYDSLRDVPRFSPDINEKAN